MLIERSKLVELKMNIDKALEAYIADTNFNYETSKIDFQTNELIHDNAKQVFYLVDSVSDAIKKALE